MTARTIANRLLEADDDFDASAELTRLTTVTRPGYGIEMEGNHWNVYKNWQGSQHFIGEVYFVDMADAPVEIMSPEARAHHEAHRWVSIAGFRPNETQECKTFEQAVDWIIAVNIAKTTPVRESDDEDIEGTIERTAAAQTAPITTEVTSDAGRRWRVQIVFDKLAGGTSYDARGRVLAEKPQPIVEFYDLAHGEKGQFVSSYFASTLVDRNPGVGLDLYGGEPAWEIDGDTMDHIMIWVRSQVEGRGFKLKTGMFGKNYEALDPDDPELYAHPERFDQQPSGEKIEGALRRMLAPYYTRIDIHKRPGMFAGRALTQTDIPNQPGAVNRLPFADSFVWTIHCNRDTPLPLSIVNRALPGYDLDWRQEVKHWFEKWAAHANLSLLKFEIYGRLRKDPTFQFETARLGPLKENEEDLSPEQFLRRHVERQDLDQKLVEALWKFHPYGVGYNAVISTRIAMASAQTYFPPEKDNFALRFRDFVLNWLTENKIMTVHSSKLTAGGGHEKDYPRWSVFLSVNIDWPANEPAYVPPTVEPGPGAPVEVGQP